MGRLLAVFLALACSASAHAAETWLEVRSPNFLVITNGSQKRAREIATDFEQIRGFFARAARQNRVDSSGKTVILALKNEASMKKLVPFFWQRKGGVRPSGLFANGPQTDYALVRLDVGPFATAVVYHEYVHRLLALNFRRLPVWLNEGLAEHYSYVLFSERAFNMGAVNIRLDLLRKRPLLPLETLLAATVSSPHYIQDEKAAMFYAQSWALVGFLIYGPGMSNGRKLDQYLTLIDQGAEPAAGFRQVFGEPAQVHESFQVYVQSLRNTVYTLKRPVQGGEKKFVSRPLDPRELGAVFADFEALVAAQQE